MKRLGYSKRFKAKHLLKILQLGLPQSSLEVILLNTVATHYKKHTI